MKRLRILRNLGKNPSNGMTGRLRRCILNWNSFRTEWIPTCSELKVENPMWIFERWCGIAAFCLHFRRLFFHLCCICVAFVLHLSRSDGSFIVSFTSFLLFRIFISAQSFSSGIIPDVKQRHSASTEIDIELNGWCALRQSFKSLNEWNKRNEWTILHENGKKRDVGTNQLKLN